MSPTLRVAESDARKILSWIVGIAAIAAIVFIGRSVTPVDLDGNPLFLSPRVARVASYQKQAEKWAFEMSGIETDMHALLDDRSSDLFAQDRAFQGINGRVVNLASAIDSTSTPATLGGLHELLTQAVAAHEEASTALGVWISEPTAETKAQALDTLAEARSILERVYDNPWVAIGQTAAHVETP